MNGKELKKSALPTLEELHHDPLTAFKDDQLNLLLNINPPDQWLKEHPTTKGKYIPIEKVEFLLTKIFSKWWVEVISYSQLFQSVAVHVRLHVINPIDGKEMIQDGLGAAPIQVDKGESAADLSKIKSGAVMMALPSAESYAIKDAAEKFGRIFGKDLNRKDTLSEDNYYKIASRWDSKNGTEN